MKKRNDQEQYVGPQYGTTSTHNFEHLKLPRPLQKIRESLSQSEKMTILMVMGFTLVFMLISLFAVSQFKEIMYGPAEAQVQRALETPVTGTPVGGAYVVDYSDALKKSLDIKQENQVGLKQFQNQWILFERQGNRLAYLDVTNQHEILEKISRRLIWIFALSEIALLLMAMALTRANMRPIMRSWEQQRTFVADAAHEFKTPMTVIQNNLERMLEHPNDTVLDQVENIAHSLTEVRHLNHLTGDLLTLAQSDADVPMFIFDHMDLAQLAREVGDIYKFNAEERGQKLNIDMPASLPMYGDAQRLRQLLVLLVDNAQKYAGKGAEVTVSAHEKKDTLTLTVVDTGSGVTDEQKKHLFDRFYRVDKARSRSTGGHGLGLSIAQWVVQGHHGTITVSDTQPHGTTFTIQLPTVQRTKKNKKKA